MVKLKRILLDVLKPHQPSALEFCKAIAKLGDDYRVSLTVQEMDEDTQTLLIEIRGISVDLEPIESVISSMGGSLHSIDQVEVQNEADDG